MFFPKTFNRGCVVSGREWEGQFRVVPVPGGPNLERAADHHYRPLLHIIAFAAGLMDCAAITSRLKHLISIRDYHISQMSQAHITQTTSILFLCAILNSHHGCSSLYNERWYLRHLTFNFLPVSLCRLILRCIYYTISIIYIHTTMRRVCRNCNCCELMRYACSLSPGRLRAGALYASASSATTYAALASVIWGVPLQRGKFCTSSI